MVSCNYAMSICDVSNLISTNFSYVQAYDGNSTSSFLRIRKDKTWVTITKLSELEKFMPENFKQRFVTQVHILK